MSNLLSEQRRKELLGIIGDAQAELREMTAQQAKSDVLPLVGRYYCYKYGKTDVELFTFIQSYDEESGLLVCLSFQGGGQDSIVLWPHATLKGKVASSGDEITREEFMKQWDRLLSRISDFGETVGGEGPKA